MGAATWKWKRVGCDEPVVAEALTYVDVNVVVADTVSEGM